MPKLPTARLSRLTKLARVGARTGASLLLSKDGAPAAEMAARVLGDLRGLAAKVGQMASYVDGMVPEAHRDAYEVALRGLRAAAPTSSYDEVAALIGTDLGGAPDALFAEFERTPFASASIGQVHRARLADGRAVAVKVQHPGIDAAVESDLKNGAVLEAMVGAMGPRALDSKQVFDEIAARFREELDYVHEAGQQTWFRSLHAGDPAICIPAIVSERSGRRVLTSELVTGGHDLAWAARQDEARRRHYAETLWRFVFKGNLVGGRFNADPHPGNYLFHEDGTVSFLDFGCVHPIATDHRREARAMHEAACRRDEAAFVTHAFAMLELTPGAYADAVVAYARACFEPLFRSPYRMERAYVRGLVHGVADMKQHIFGRDSGFTKIPRGIVWMNRLQFGFYSVLAQLDVVADYAEVERRFLA